MPTQFPPRLLLTGAVLTALTASGGTVLTFPEVTAPAPQSAAAAPIAAAPLPAPAPSTPPQADGAQIAGLAAAPKAAPAPRARAERAPSKPDRPVDMYGRGLSEADWARLPPNLRQRVRAACDAGYLKGAHCSNA